MSSLDEIGTATTGGIRFSGPRDAYWHILTRGGVLLGITLGIYRFWLTTDVRRFLWSNTEVAGDSLEYNGTALELLIGFLVAIVILIPLYAIFFLMALEIGPVGEVSGLVAVATLGLLSQYGVYRARRYRLTRTVFRGLRFHMEGSAWRYAFYGAAWWIATILTFGLTYPFQLASLERFKMRNTYYGDLGGDFDGSGLRLFLRGVPMWFMVMVPLLLALGALIEGVDWNALAEAVDQGGDPASIDPFLGGVIAFAILMGVISMTAAILLFPAFQALVLRWWSSGLRFGTIEMRSTLRTLQVYAAYLRFLGYAILFGIVAGIAALPALWIVGLATGGDSVAGEIFAVVILLAGYVIVALGLSTIYRATVRLALWQLGMESLQLSGLSALEDVRASGRASSALGEGLVDALNVGGY